MSNLRRAFAALLLIVSSTAFGKQPLEDIQRADYPVPPNVAITLRLGDGTVHIYGSGDNVIELTAIKKAYTKERLDAIKVNVTVNGQNAAIETTLPPKAQGLGLEDRSGTVDYVLLVPQNCSLKSIEVENGEIILEGIRGDGVNVGLTNGRMLAKNCFAPTNLTLGRGGVDLAYGWWEDGRSFAVNAQSKNGDIHVALPKTAGARFDATTGDGWIRNDFAKDEGNDDARSLQWTMGEDPTVSFTLRTQSGNLRIDKPY
ncbi:MAG: DUF4097 family beta strand repeat-containing protein [Chthoniobacterales bacterium]